MMKELEYPFDAAWILSNRKKIKKSFLMENNNYIEKKVVILGGATTANVVQILDLFLLNNGIKASFYESEFGMYYEEALFPSEELAKFQPDVFYIHTCNRNITKLPHLGDSVEEIEKALAAEKDKYKSI